MTEQELIRRLKRLEREWPEGYLLASMAGSLCLFGPDRDGEDGDLDAEKVLWSTFKIENTGGDW
jgi:hypothetical protein